MNPTVLEDYDVWSEIYDKETIAQATKMIELMYKKLNIFYATVNSVIFKLYIIQAYKKFYGVEWKKLSECSKSA